MRWAEGFRRIGILAGAAGAVVAVIAEAPSAITVKDEWRAATRFERIIKQPTMAQTVREASVYPADLPKGAVVEDIDYDALAKQYGAISSAPGKRSAWSPPAADADQWRPVKEGALPRGMRLTRSPRPGAESTEIVIAAHSGGVEHAFVDAHGEVVGVELSTGEILAKTDKPSVWRVALLLGAPLIGFLLPWGSIRALSWAVSGFTEAGHDSTAPRA